MTDPCPTCKKYRKFIQAMVVEWDKYGANKTAQYYKNQCEKILKQTGGGDCEVRDTATS